MGISYTMCDFTHGPQDFWLNGGPEYSTYHNRKQARPESPGTLSPRLLARAHTSPLCLAPVATRVFTLQFLILPHPDCLARFISDCLHWKSS